MSQRKKSRSPGPAPMPALLREKIKPPVVLVLGTPAEVANVVTTLGTAEVTCYQMDRFPAERIRENLGAGITLQTAPDLWDLPAEFQTVLYLPARAGERELKIDMIEQAYHILRPHGQILVWSPYEVDSFFPTLLKKIFGRASSYALDQESVFASTREGERPRRRHEVTFQVRVNEHTSCRFVSRPGVFAYGRFDMGARAMMETVELSPGERVLDLGCGCGTNGVLAWQQVGPGGHITFVDTNCRAVALAELNARQNGVTSFDAHATTTMSELQPGSYDVVLANPPYFAQGAIARYFLEQARIFLKPQGRCYLVTKSPDEIGTMMNEIIGSVEFTLARNYFILSSG